jgi:hypothetical protein
MVNRSDKIVKSKEEGGEIDSDTAHEVFMRACTREEKSRKQQRRTGVKQIRVSLGELCKQKNLEQV